MITVELTQEQIDFLMNVLTDSADSDMMIDYYRNRDDDEDYLANGGTFYGIPLDANASDDENETTIHKFVEELKTKIKPLTSYED